jgi:hypothetical protein
MNVNENYTKFCSGTAAKASSQRVLVMPGCAMIVAASSILLVCGKNASTSQLLRRNIGATIEDIPC